MKILNQIFLRGRNFLFPADCALCEGALIEPNEMRLGLCQDCLASISPNYGSKCTICGKPLISEIDTCLHCRDAQYSYDRLWTVFPYTGKYRKLLAEYKFEKKLPLANFFAEQITEIIKNEPLLENAVIVPVPPRPGKIKKNGWDQVECLIKRLEKIMPDVTVSRCLKRSKSRVQKELNRNDRLNNLKGRIVINGKVPDTALIIDDVITTGATMEVCSEALKNNGTQKVYGICLFYD
jgi:ComF family protein